MYLTLTNNFIRKGCRQKLGETKFRPQNNRTLLVWLILATFKVGIGRDGVAHISHALFLVMSIRSFPNFQSILKHLNY